MRIDVSTHDSGLGRWTRAIAVPDGLLAGAVGALWWVEGRTAFAADRRLPTTDSHLLFSFGEPQRLLALGGAPIAPRCFDRGFVSGPQRRWIETAAEGNTALLGAALTPFGAGRILGRQQAELVDQVLDLDQVLGAEGDALHQRLGNAVRLELRFTLLADWLRARWLRGPAIDPLLAHALPRLARPPAPSIAQLCRELGVSPTWLARLFRQQTGISARHHAGIARFTRAFALATGGRHSWEAIARRCGYYDPSHLVGDFRLHMGESPTRLLALARPDEGSVVIATDR